MIKKFFKISFYSFITFCVVNFLSLIYSIIFNKLNWSFPNFDFGLPFEFYHQLQVRNYENCYQLQHGFNVKNFIYDLLFSTIIVALYFILKSLHFELTKKAKQNNEFK